VRVLVVEADLRKARLHQVFGEEREPGLSDVLIGDVAPNQAIRKTEVPGLYVMTAGQAPPNPSELLGSPRMAQLIGRLRKAFELVIFDTPPLRAAGDAAILGARTDGVVLVVKAGSTDQDAARDAVRQLDNVHARVLGAVLNDPNQTIPKYGGYYHYSYYGEE
jgi:polysaccharide biosynthesis transport protein